MDNIRCKNIEGRQGIALIVVVGILALMMVMAVSFSIFMRTERVAAGSFKSDVRARQLLHVALNRAMAEIDANMLAGTNVYPDFEMLQTPGSNVSVALTKSMFDQIPVAALSTQGVCMAGAPGYLVIGRSVSDKGAVINLTDHSFGVVTNVDGVSGNYRVDHTALTGGRLNTWQSGDQYCFLNPGMVDADQGEGRYGYVVVNCSGLVDANQVGGMARGVGTNAMEIQIQSLAGAVNTNNLITQRQAANFETLQELIVRGRPQGVFANFPEHFVCYSSGKANDGRVYIGGTAADIVSRRAQIISALTNLSCQDSSILCSSFSLAEAGVLFTNLVDFVDSDNTPGNLGDAGSSGNPSGPYVEKVPMANEIVVTNRVVFNLVPNPDPAVQNYTMAGTNYVSVEFATPILNSQLLPNFSWSLALEGTSGNAVMFPLQGTSYASAPMASGLPLISPYMVKQMQLPMVGDPVPKPISFAGLTNDYTVKVMTKYNATVVDVVTNPGVSVRVPVVVTPVGVPNAAGAYAQYVGVGVGGRECIDPRLNWAASSWASRTSTLGSINIQALLRLNPYTYGNSFDIGLYGARSKGKDGDTVMYVADAALNSVGDMGYLFYGNTVNSAWETVRLFRIGTNNFGGMHAVLDHFTVDNPVGMAPKGRVNPNTKNLHVLNSVFMNMPLNRRHVTGGVSAMLSPTQLDAVMAAIIGRSTNSDFKSLAALGGIRWDVIFPTSNSLEKESVLRNSCRMLDVRNNLFLILLYADVTKKDRTGNSATLSAVMGIAEVWRDPLDAANWYPASIHLFQVAEAP